MSLIVGVCLGPEVYAYELEVEVGDCGVEEGDRVDEVVGVGDAADAVAEHRSAVFAGEVWYGGVVDGEGVGDCVVGEGFLGVAEEE